MLNYSSGKKNLLTQKSHTHTQSLSLLDNPNNPDPIISFGMSWCPYLSVQVRLQGFCLVQQGHATLPPRVHQEVGRKHGL